MKTILLFTVLTLSMIAFAQSKSPTHFLNQKSSGSIENEKRHIIDNEIITMNTFNPAKVENAFLHTSATAFSSIQIVDSLYTWSWDIMSDDWKLESRMIDVVYDAGNNMINSTDQNWDGTAWVNSDRYTYTYDANHNMTSELSKVWMNETWVNDMMNAWTYDANFNETRVLTQIWDESTWVNEYQTLYTYNANNNPTSMIYQSWGGMDWENSEKITYTYDASYNLIVVLTQVWDGASWENESKESSIYDSNNRKTSSLTQVWTGSEWSDELKISYTYTNSNLVKEVTEFWNSGAWENYSQKEYSYDAGNHMILQLEKLWEGSQWVNFQKADYAYDQNMNLTDTRVVAWDGSTWLNFYEMNYGYDENNFTEFLVWKKWDDEGNLVAYGDSMYVFYHTVPTSLPDLAEPDLKIYPNPCSQKLSISSSNAIRGIEIYSLTGNRLYYNYTFRQQTSNEIDLTGYAKGIYILKIYYGTKFISRKIIVQ